MFTDVQIINIGLSKISANRIARIDPPKTPLEAFMASNYPHWKRVELTKRRWVFALVDDYTLTVSETLTNVAQPYKYALPTDCLRPVRTKCTEWKQRGRFLFSAYSTGLKISYIRNADESEFDPLFNDVLAAAIALGSYEFVTQSTSKGQMAAQLYKDAVDIAGQANAFTIGSEDVGSDDDNFDWLTSRYG